MNCQIASDFACRHQRRSVSKYLPAKTPKSYLINCNLTFTNKSNALKQTFVSHHSSRLSIEAHATAKQIPDERRTFSVEDRSVSRDQGKSNYHTLEGSSSLGDAEKLLDTISAPVHNALDSLTKNLTETVGKGHPLLMAAAQQIFGGKGKRLRPTIVLLIGKATEELLGRSGDPELSEGHMRLAEIMEIIHTASLVHDDVLDESDTRRGRRTVNNLYGTRVAVLVGDYLFAQSSWLLACLGNVEVIRLVSQVIANFAQGEVSQATRLFDCTLTLQQYLDKSFCKTASLIAAGCRSAAAISNCPEHVKSALFEYGRCLGLAFQIIDDILDFTETTQQLGKPRGQDLATGNLTAPALYALWANAGNGELKGLIESRLEAPGALERALKLVDDAGGVSAARRLAAEQAARARECLNVLPASSASRHSLELMVDYTLMRTR